MHNGGCSEQGVPFAQNADAMCGADVHGLYEVRKTHIFNFDEIVI